MPKRKALSKAARSEVRQIAKKQTLTLAETKELYCNEYRKLHPVQARIGSTIAVRGFMLNRNLDFSQVPLKSPMYNAILRNPADTNSQWRTATTNMVYGSLWADDARGNPANPNDSPAQTTGGFAALPFFANRRFHIDMLANGDDAVNLIDSTTNQSAQRINRVIAKNIIEGHEIMPTSTKIEWCIQRDPLIIRPVDIIKRNVKPSTNADGSTYVDPRLHTAADGSIYSDVWGGQNELYDIKNSLANAKSGVDTINDVVNTIGDTAGFATALAGAVLSDGFDIVADAAVVASGIGVVDQLGTDVEGFFGGQAPNAGQRADILTPSASQSKQSPTLSNGSPNPNYDPREESTIADFKVLQGDFDTSEGAIAPYLSMEKKLLRDAGFSKYFTTHQMDYQYRFVRVKLKSTKFAGTYPDPRKDLFMNNQGVPTGIKDYWFLPSNCRDYKLNTKLYTVLDDKQFSLGCPGAVNSTPQDTFGGIPAKKNSSVCFTTDHKQPSKAQYQDYMYTTYDTLNKNDQTGLGANLFPLNESPNEFIAIHCWIDQQNDFVYPLTYDAQRTFRPVGKVGSWLGDKSNANMDVPMVPGMTINSTSSGGSRLAHSQNVDIDQYENYSLVSPDGVDRKDAYMVESEILSIPHEYRNDQSTTNSAAEESGQLVADKGMLNRHPRDACIQAPNDWTMDARCVAKFKDF